MSTTAFHQQNSLRYLFISLLVIPFSISTVSAATHAWQGPYIGAYVGEGFGNNHLSTNVGVNTNNPYFATQVDMNAVNDAGTSVKKPKSFIIGIQAGHDWVWKQLVYGIVFDYGTLPLSSSKNVNNATYPDNTDTYSVYTSMNTNWLFTLRGRLGFQAPLRWPSLFYVTGGMGVTQLKVNTNFSDNSAYAGAGGTDTFQNKIGWTAGAGIEVAACDHVSVGLEYLYLNVPSVKVSSSISNTQPGFGIPTQSLTNPFSTMGAFHASLVKLGLSYRFDE